MARDPKNVWQHTPKQIQGKVVKFISIPEQFAPFAKRLGLLDEAEDLIDRDNFGLDDDEDEDEDEGKDENQAVAEDEDEDGEEESGGDEDEEESGEESGEEEEAEDSSDDE